MQQIDKNNGQHLAHFEVLLHTGWNHQLMNLTAFDNDFCGKSRLANLK